MSHTPESFAQLCIFRLNGRSEAGKTVNSDDFAFEHSGKCRMEVVAALDGMHSHPHSFHGHLLFA